MKSLAWNALCISAIVAVVVSILIGVPHRDLEWDETIIPMAQRYAATITSTTTIKDTNATQKFPLEGITVLITGATSGIGLSLTHSFIKLGATVIALGRSSTKLGNLRDKCEKEINQQSSPGSIQIFVVDLTDLNSVGIVGRNIAAELNSIDILVNNAGIHGLDDMFAKNAVVGHDPPYDRVFVVNYLSHFLLTEHLLPLLRKSQYKPVIAQTTSSYHWAVDGTDLLPLSVISKDGIETKNMPIAAQPGGSHGYYIFRTQRSYANSKLAQIYHTRALQQKIRSEMSSTGSVESDVSSDIAVGWKTMPRIVSFCPGWVATNIAGDNDTFATKILSTLAFPMFGWGIASGLHSILDTSTDDSNNIGTNDYYINSNVFLLAGYIFPTTTPPWLYKYAIRDVITNLVSYLGLLTQHLGSNAFPTRSSPESYNVSNAILLYDWSHNAIRPYL